MRVAVIGTGLIGTSVALALREHGVSVWLADTDPEAARLAANLGAGGRGAMLLPAGQRMAGHVTGHIAAEGPGLGHR